MIEVRNLHKRFDEIVAINDISASIGEGQVFGLIGTNGAGKSTLLKMLAGILKPDRGEILIDEMSVFENPKVKSELFYISDDQFYFQNDTPDDMKNFYKTMYRKFDSERFYHLIDGLGLDKNRKISTFSKGMKKQLSVALGVAANTKYLLCDETFDGLDPVMRQAVKSIFANDIEQRGLTPIIASHNLRELEDICDHVGLLHKGGILFTRDLEDMKLGLHKIQCVFAEETTIDDLKELEILSTKQIGSIYTITVRGTEEEVMDAMRGVDTIFFEMVPLTLEEIFISETEVKGYDIKKLVL